MSINDLGNRADLHPTRLLGERSRATPNLLPDAPHFMLGAARRAILTELPTDILAFPIDIPNLLNLLRLCLRFDRDMTVWLAVAIR